MRLRITHETVFSFDEPATYAIQTLRLMPRGSEQQFVVDWRIDVSQDCRLSPVEDHFGNLTHSFSIDGPMQELSIVASGEVMTEETAGVVRGLRERLPLALYRRDTPLTAADPAIRTLAAEIRDGAGGETLATLHALMHAVHVAAGDAVATADDAERPAAAVLAGGTGASRDLAHVFISAARSLGIPARFISGYMLRPDGDGSRDDVHSWAEAHVGDGLGWIGFDPQHDQCPTEAYVRIACGLDHLEAAPIRGTRYGGTGETVRVQVTVEKLGDF